jgi:nuclear RNA export factor
LTIEETGDSIPGPGAPSTNEPDGKAAETKQKLIAVLASRYDAQQGLLNLAALGSDPTLISMGSFATASLAEKSFKALLHLTNTQYKNAAEKEAAIQAVSLANNDIVDVGTVFTLAHTLPRLRRLDLSSNKLEDLSKLSKWRHEFRYLEELHLVGNPVVEQPNYRAQIIDWFPSLQILNGERVRTPEEATENLKAFIPTPVAKLPSNIRDGSNNVAATFLHGFFSLYDHDRRSLAFQFYDDESVFSINTGANSVDSESYNKYSRDIAKLGVRNPRTQQRLITGVNLISELWVLLPPTRHPGLDQPEQWLVDSHTFANLLDPSGQPSAIGLTINVVSQFEELDPSQQLAGIRKFARSFVLGPSKPGAPHPYRVVSDELTLKDWTPHQVNVAVPIPAAPIAVAPPVTAAPRVLDEATQALMIQELSRQTGMNAEYSRLCLSGPADWNFDLALKSFHEKRAELPAEAFVMSA